MMKIYLAGYIHGGKLKECMEWRKRIREYYENYKGARYPIEWLDPLNSGEKENIDHLGLTSNLPSNMIVHKDYVAVKNCDLVVANMTTFGESRPLIGTVCELAWAWELHKPIIMIAEEEMYAKHPFLKTFASVIVKSLDELLPDQNDDNQMKWINLFYKSMNSAQY